jgi:hypothetical protein
LAVAAAVVVVVPMKEMMLLLGEPKMLLLGRQERPSVRCHNLTQNMQAWMGHPLTQKQAQREQATSCGRALDALARACHAWAWGPRWKGLGSAGCKPKAGRADAGVLLLHGSVGSKPKVGEVGSVLLLHGWLDKLLHGSPQPKAGPCKSP